MKTMNNKTDRNREGAAILAVMGIVFLIAAVAAGMMLSGKQQVFSAIRLRDYVKAQMIAEAGVNDAYNLIKTNFAARLNAANFPTTSFDGGYYDAEVSAVGSNTASIVCTGMYGSAIAMVHVDLKNYATTTTNGAPTPGVGPFGFCVLAGGDLGWAGNSDMQMSNGFFHCNGAYSANGANYVYGNVEACNGITLGGGASIYGTGTAPTISGMYTGTPVIATVPVIGVPDIDLTPYYNAALSSNQVFTGNKIISGNVSPPGGIMWVNGTLSIGAGNYTGCFIATGGIELKSAGASDSITMNKYARYPVLASRDGSIVVKQAKDFIFNGLIYVKTGYFDKSGNGDVHAQGAIISAGSTTKNGGWAAFIYSDPTPVPPGGSLQYTLDKVVITAWQD